MDWRDWAYIYDYIVIDSAPCILVSDTFQISKFADASVYVVRSNFTEKHILEYIDDLNKSGKLNNMGIVINEIGASKRFGSNFSYGYSYKYGYNYGYGYGYGNK